MVDKIEICCKQIIDKYLNHEVQIFFYSPMLEGHLNFFITYSFTSYDPFFLISLKIFTFCPHLILVKSNTVWRNISKFLFLQTDKKNSLASTHQDGQKKTNCLVQNNVFFA